MPILSVSLEISSNSRELKRENDMCMNIRYKVTYHGVGTTDSISPTADPITFLIDIFNDELNYNLDHRVSDSDSDSDSDSEQWITCRYGRGYCPGIASDQPSKIYISLSEAFVCLHPGQSWEGSFAFDDEIWEFPDHLRIGAMFRLSFKGATIRWWDWGTKDDHVDTVLTFRGYGQKLSAPDFTDDDNGGRPRIFVPCSNEIGLVLAD